LRLRARVPPDLERSHLPLRLPFPDRRVILETNGRRWHDDARDYERDHEKWSVPARCGYRIVFATWDKVTRAPEALVGEVTAALAA
jgi:very-short-patch-repair endonuclease